MGLAPIMPHLTCVGSSRDELNALADEIWHLGYRNVMTLRGDPPQGETEFRPHADGLPQARDLVALLRERHPEFCCGVAGYPETHPEAVSPEQDVQYLKQKLDAGGGFVTTQLFFENQVYFDFVERCRAAGITQPIVPGLLPAVSLKQANRIAGMCQAALPDELVDELTAAGDNAEAAAEVGMDWGARQIEELLAHGVPGIHMYILNRAHTGLALAMIQNFSKFKSRP
jgi:methylenetetrahydrofolate reductase (NADPH)